MPIATQVDCPECDQPLVRRLGGRCPNCGTDVRDHVLRARLREKRIEQVVAVVSTILVLSLSLMVGGCTVIEGALAYAVAGAAMWFYAKRTFYDRE